MATDNKGDFLIGLLVGGALGAALALLYAPFNGEKARDKIKNTPETLKYSALETYDRIREQTAAISAQVRNSD